MLVWVDTRHANGEGGDELGWKSIEPLNEITVVSKNLVRRASCVSLFFVGHLIKARWPLEAPASANEKALRKKSAEDELELCKQAAMHSKRAFNDARGGQGFWKQL